MFTYSNGALVTDERYDGRTSVIELPDLSGTVIAAINVSSLRESDTGDYECRVTYGAGDGSQSTQSTPPQSLSSPLPSLTPPLLSSTVPPSITVSTDVGDAGDGVRFVRLDVQGKPSKNRRIFLGGVGGPKRAWDPTFCSCL